MLIRFLLAFKFLLHYLVHVSILHCAMQVQLPEAVLHGGRSGLHGEVGGEVDAERVANPLRIIEVDGDFALIVDSPLPSRVLGFRSWLEPAEAAEPRRTVRRIDSGTPLIFDARAAPRSTFSSAEVKSLLTPISPMMPAQTSGSSSESRSCSPASGSRLHQETK